MQQPSRRHSNSSEEPFLKFLTESNYLESEQSSQETQQTLTKCKTEHALQPMLQFNSNSFTIFDKKHKFTFPTHEIMEWETLQLSYPPEVFNFLMQLKHLSSAGNLIFQHDQIPTLLKSIIKSPKEFFNFLLDKGWISRTTRQFNEQTLYFYSLTVKRITYENLVWIIKSIKLDCITPTERLVQSRIKECFSVKLHAYEWEFIMNSLKNIKNNPLKFRNSNGKLIELPLIQLKNIKDPLINENTYGLFLGEGVVEDQQIPDLEKKPEWSLFVEFLKEFFNNASKDKNNRILKGGRYGCAQFIKLLGPPKLRELSLGRLTLFVQMAVNKGYIKYNKTILMQESIGAEKSEPVSDSSEEQNPKRRIKELQFQLIELLVENTEGVSLAQIPTLLKERVGFELNLGELGFPKLKNFIESVKDVILIENSGKNNFIAKVLLHKVPQNILQKIQQKDSEKNFLLQVMHIIKCILSKHKYGISMNQLYHDLSSQLGEWFPFQRFQCQSFFQFLKNYADEMIVIVCQKEGQYWIYERNLRFLPPPSPRNEMNDQQFDQILSEAFPCSLGMSYTSNSWLGRASDSHISNPPVVEDSHQEIKENLKFIDELLGGEFMNNETFQDWSEKSMNPWGMLSSINYGECEKNDFELEMECKKKQ